MKKISYIILLLFIIGCSKSDDTEDESSTCLQKDFLETFVVEPNECFIFNDNSDMTFTFLGFESYTKTHPNNVPHARISARLEEENFTWEFYTGMVHEDHELEGTSFSGRVHTGINNVDYTIFFDDIEFTKTETEFIFHRATIRFGYYDSEFD
jgi:hypothetical protein